MPATSPGVTLTATLTDASGVAIQGKIVCTLNNFGPGMPRVAGSNIIANQIETGLANGSGAVSIALFGNYQIAAPGSYYEIACYGVDANGNVSNAPNIIANYQFNGAGTFDLSNLAAMGTTNPGASPAVAARFIAQGSSLASGDFILTGWGAGATITDIHGSDMAHRFTITCGTGPTISPTIQLTFHDGGWAHTPVMYALITGGTGAVEDIGIARTATTYTLTYEGLPISTQTYTIEVICIGVLN